MRGDRPVRLAIALLLIAVALPVRAETSVKAFNIIAPWDGVSPFDDPSEQGVGVSVLPLGQRSGLDNLLVGSVDKVFRLFLTSDGRVFEHTGLDSIVHFGRPTAANPSGGWVGSQPNWAVTASFGRSLAVLSGPAANGDMIVAVGAPGHGGAGIVEQVFIVSVREDGRATLLRTIASPSGAVTEYFGWSLAATGDLDGDGIGELAVGAIGGGLYGGVWLLFLNADYSVKSSLRIDENLPGFSFHPFCGGGSCFFGWALAALGDLDANGTPDLAATDHGDNVTGMNGRVYVMLLEPNGAGSVRVKSGGLVFLGDTGVAGFPFDLSNHDGFGTGLAWLGDQTRPPQGGGVLAVGAADADGVATSCGTVFMLRLRPDGTVRRGYEISRESGVGYAPPDIRSCSEFGSARFGHAIAALGDLDGDEVSDLVVTAPVLTDYNAQGSTGAVVVLLMRDSDHDGLDDNLDNCPNVHNPQQADADADGVGDLCDNCPTLANTNQDDVDGDLEGDLCEPVEVQLTTTGTPASPSWSLSVSCGAFNATQINGAIVLPAGSTNPKALTLDGTSIGGGSGTSGPGLMSPSGVRGDAIYFSVLGNGAGGRLCTALKPPTYLGRLTTGSFPPGSTQLAAAALTAEGVGVPGFGLPLAQSTAGTVPQSKVRLVNGLPLPILRLELGPAVVTSGGTRWNVIAKNASAEFHRVTFGLIAPVGTTTSQMRWVGCNTTPSGIGVRSCTGGTGFGSTVSAANSFTQGPLASPPGTQLPHTLYVSLVGNRPSQSSQLTFNPVNGPTQVTLGTVELDASPDLEPAITVDGVESVTTNPLQKADAGVPSPTQLRLIGAFDPAEDLDGDEIQDLSDDCPFAYDPAQENRGSFLSSDDDSDALGDACQCGESTGDGAVLAADFAQIRDYLSGLITSPTLAAQIEARCSVAGPTDCNIRDLAVLKKALDAGAASVATKCDAALSPATGTP